MSAFDSTVTDKWYIATTCMYMESSIIVIVFYGIISELTCKQVDSICNALQSWTDVKPNAGLWASGKGEVNSVGVCQMAFASNLSQLFTPLINLSQLYVLIGQDYF